MLWELMDPLGSAGRILGTSVLAPFFNLLVNMSFTEFLHIELLPLTGRHNVGIASEFMRLYHILHKHSYFRVVR